MLLRNITWDALMLCWRQCTCIFNTKSSQNPSWKVGHGHLHLQVCHYDAVSVPPVTCWQPMPDSRFTTLQPHHPMCKITNHFSSTNSSSFVHNMNLIMPGRLLAAGPYFAVLAINIPSSFLYNEGGKEWSRSLWRWWGDSMGMEWQFPIRSTSLHVSPHFGSLLYLLQSMPPT